MADRIQFRRDTLANWTSANPVLLDGEMVLVATDETKPYVYDSKKVGDGVHAFNDLEMLGYECLQELGDSTQFPVSQKVVSDYVNEEHEFRGIGTSSLNVEYTPKSDCYWNGNRYVEISSLNSTEKINVSAGTTVQIKGKGGQNDGRLVYYYNNNDELIFKSNSGSNLENIPVFEDGYIICNSIKGTEIEILSFSDNSIFNQLITNSNKLNAYLKTSVLNNKEKININSKTIFSQDIYDNSKLQVGYYHFGDLEVGDVAPDNPFNSPSGQNWGYIIIPVIKGEIIEIKAKGGLNGRTYALTDNDKKILILADAYLDTLSNSAILSVESDGYLYVNQSDITNTAFSIVVKQDKIEKISKTIFSQDIYDNSKLQVGYYYRNGGFSVGDTHPVNPGLFGEGNTAWGCIVIPVIKGEIAIIATKGGANGRAYALTDNNRKILTLADASLDTISNPITLTIEENGYLYVNQNDTTNAAFNITINKSINLQVQNLNTRITELEENPAPSIVAPKMYNPILNLQKEQLRILDIGNSYTADATHYLPEIVTASGIDISNICLYTAQRGGASFKTWFDTYHDKDDKIYTIGKCFGELTANITGTADVGNGEKFRNALINNEWDLIIIHQVSNYAPYFDKWEEDSGSGYLSKFIRLLRKHQPKATIGFLLVHSYWSNYNGNTEKSSLERWKLIAESAKKMRANYGIDFIIPYGTAIQNLRESSLNNEYDLTADGTHCANGIADYTAACTYFQSLLSPRYGVSVLGNSARITVEQTETYPSSNISVTDENAPTCQKAAFIATYNWYECINPDDINDEDLI